MNFLLVYTLTLITTKTLADLEQQNLHDDQLDPVNDYEYDDQSKDHDKRTLFANNIQNYGWAKHIAIEPSGHKVVIGYSPVDLKYLPVARPISIRPQIKPAGHPKPTLVLKPIRPKPVYGAPIKPLVPINVPPPPHVVQKPSWEQEVWSKPVVPVKPIHPVPVRPAVPVAVPIRPAVPVAVPIRPVVPIVAPPPVHFVPVRPIHHHPPLVPVRPVHHHPPPPPPPAIVPVKPHFVPSPLFEVTKPNLGVLPLGASFPSTYLAANSFVPIPPPHIPAFHHHPVTLPHAHVGIPHAHVGIPHAHVGIPHAHVGIPHAHVGIPHAHVGIPHAHIAPLPIPQAPVRPVAVPQPLLPRPALVPQFPMNPTFNVFHVQQPQPLPHPPHEQHDVQTPLIPANHPNFFHNFAPQHQQLPDSGQHLFNPHNGQTVFQQQLPEGNPQLFNQFQQLPQDINGQVFNNFQPQLPQDGGQQPFNQHSHQVFQQNLPEGHTNFFNQVNIDHSGGGLSIQPGETDLDFPRYLPQHPFLDDQGRGIQDPTQPRPALSLEPPFHK